MSLAVYDKLDDRTLSGRIPPSRGVLAFGTSLRASEEELHSTLENWTLVGLKLGHPLPIIGGRDLKKEPAREPVDTL